MKIPYMHVLFEDIGKNLKTKPPLKTSLKNVYNGCRIWDVPKCYTISDEILFTCTWAHFPSLNYGNIPFLSLSPRSVIQNHPHFPLNYTVWAWMNAWSLAKTPYGRNYNIINSRIEHVHVHVQVHLYTHC